MERESTSPFNYMELLIFPLRNNHGQVIPLEVVHEYMKDVQDRPGFELALVRLKQHQFTKRASSRSLQVLQDEIRKQLGIDPQGD